MADADRTQTDADAYEASRPEWQQKFNLFCENWLFAFLIAMAVRHFVLEPFRIPTTSMEPMLYGDPSFTKGDLVVVDKIWSRITGLHRWDVAVFQFPLPELEAPKADARPALTENGDRLDDPLLHPLLNRSFVKRIVGVPGDKFYISAGNYYVQQPDGTFQVCRRPPDIQEVMWDPVYRHGAQAGYLPWEATAKAAVQAEGGALKLDLVAGSGVTFTQPLINLYLKPGEFQVASSYAKQYQVRRLSQIEPAFELDGQQGNAWDVRNWLIKRMNSADLADLDNARSSGRNADEIGRPLNDVGNEPVADLRWTLVPQSITGRVEFRYQIGTERYVLEFWPDRWRMQINGVEREAGAESPSQHRFALARIDDDVVLAVDGKERIRLAQPPVAVAALPVVVSWSGEGSISLAALGCDRDVHYCVRGFLQPGMAASSYLQDTQVRALIAGKPYADMSTKDLASPIAVSPATAQTIPDGRFLMLGDNSMVSWDCRNWGYVPAENFRGRAWIVAFPFPRCRVIR